MNIDNKIDLQKITPYTVGYRDGIFFALQQLSIFVDGEKDINDTKLFINAGLKDIEIFTHYGTNCKMCFIEWERKFDKSGKMKNSKPIKAKIYSPEEKLIYTKQGYRSYREIAELVIAVNEAIQKEKDDKIKILEEKIKELEEVKSE